MAYHVFISYRRQGASELALLLYKQLLENGYSPFLDVKEMSSGHFDNQLYDRIAECSDMLVLLPPDAFAHGKGTEDWFYNEVSYALRAGKNVIPVMLPGFQWPQTMLPFMDELRYCQGVEFNTQYFDAMYAKIRDLISYKPTLSSKPASHFRRSIMIVLLICAVLAAGAAGMLLGSKRSEKATPAATTHLSVVTPSITSPTRTPTLSPTHTPTPSPTHTPTPSPTHTPTPTPSRTYYVGQHLTIGQYMHEPISWTILTTNGTKALVITDMMIETMRFTPKHTNVNWANSDVRTWMNSVFLTSAFSSSERNAILPTSVVTYHDTFITTTDYIFSLSAGEARAYLHSYYATATAYARERGTVENCWQLRDSEQGGKQITFVLKGSIYNNVPTNAKGYGLRPAMWIDMSRLP